MKEKATKKAEGSVSDKIDEMEERVKECFG